MVWRGLVRCGVLLRDDSDAVTVVIAVISVSCTYEQQTINASSASNKVFDIMSFLNNCVLFLFLATNVPTQSEWKRCCELSCNLI